MEGAPMQSNNRVCVNQNEVITVSISVSITQRAITREGDGGSLSSGGTSSSKAFGSSHEWIQNQSDLAKR